MNTFKVFFGGRQDNQGNYVGGTLDSVHTNERDAFQRVREIAFSTPIHAHHIIYILREGDERFFIRRVGDNLWYIMDKSTQRYIYGVCQSEEDARIRKAWCERYHTEGWYY